VVPRDMKCKQVTYQDKCSWATRAPKRRGYEADVVISFVPDLGGWKINDPKHDYTTEPGDTVDGTNSRTTDATNVGFDPLYIHMFWGLKEFSINSL